MMYKCVEGDQERVAEVSIEDDYEHGLHIHSFSYIADQSTQHSNKCLA